MPSPYSSTIPITGLRVLGIVSEKPYQPERIVLASQSARRLELLQQIGIEPVCLPVSADESALEKETATELVERLAILKAHTCSKASEFLALRSAGECYLLIGADTVIDLDGQILGKPENEEHGIDMLQRLSDREHVVRSGVCVLRDHDQTSQTVVVSTRVRFGQLSEAQCRQYWSTGEPLGKAGAYAIQGRGAQFVQNLSGSYSNVVGLPLFETSELLRQCGLFAT